MARKCNAYPVSAELLDEDERKLVAQWEREPTRFALVSTRCVAAYMLLHDTYRDPSNRARFRTVVDFIFVPEPERRCGVAHDLLMSSRAHALDLVAFTMSDASDSLFGESGFEREGRTMGCPIWTRDNIDSEVQRERKIVGLESRPELNGQPVRLIRLDRSRYECMHATEGLRLKPKNLGPLVPRAPLRTRKDTGGDELVSSIYRRNVNEVGAV